MSRGGGVIMEDRTGRHPCASVNEERSFAALRMFIEEASAPLNILNGVKDISSLLKSSATRDRSD
jgi:hypothetical protein